MAETIARLMHWRLHLVVLVLACLAEVIGIIQIDIGIGTVVLLPLLYAFSSRCCSIRTLFLAWAMSSANRAQVLRRGGFSSA